MLLCLFATLDTKGVEAGYVRDRLLALDVPVRLVDAGSAGTPTLAADVTREELFAAAGTTLAEVQAQGDRGTAVGWAARGAAALARLWLDRGELAGVLGLGGSAGTTIGTAAMRALPLGVPKLMVSTLASGQVRPYVGDKDVLMLNAVTDIAGLNRISRTVLNQAAEAMAGLLQFRSSRPPVPTGSNQPLVAATMFGVTTPCVQAARGVLERAGCEVLVFHATGAGGQALESLLAEGLVDGVLDLTTTELADELVGGVLSAGPERLLAAGRAGLPQVISVGALDMVNFGPESTVPAEFARRQFHRHNANVTLMRTTAGENRALGRELGRKAASARGPVLILLPARGVSALDAEGQPFDSPEARRELFAGIRETCGGVAVEECDCHINDPRFGRRAAEWLLEELRRSAPARPSGKPPTGPG